MYEKLKTALKFNHGKSFAWYLKPVKTLESVTTVFRAMYLFTRV